MGRPLRQLNRMRRVEALRKAGHLPPLHAGEAPLERELTEKEQTAALTHAVDQVLKKQKRPK